MGRGKPKLFHITFTDISKKERQTDRQRAPPTDNSERERQTDRQIDRELRPPTAAKRRQHVSLKYIPECLSLSSCAHGPSGEREFTEKERKRNDCQLAEETADQKSGVLVSSLHADWPVASVNHSSATREDCRRCHQLCVTPTPSLSVSFLFPAIISIDFTDHWLIQREICHRRRHLSQ